MMAKQTVAICEAGYYETPSGQRVDIARELAAAKAGTMLCSPEKPPARQSPLVKRPTTLQVQNETTFQALARLDPAGGHLACLNFASAMNPGGGFLNGSIAQEEALACASGLYPCLLTAPEYYARNRANRSALYLDMVIFSPRVPFFRDDHGTLLERPVLASIITAPAPNAGAIAQNEPAQLSQIEVTLRRRAELALAVAQANGVERLVLGAWGCGVFRNDPKLVARIFAELLQAPGRFASAFAEVVFAVLDRSESATTYRAFAERFNKGAV